MCVRLLQTSAHSRRSDVANCIMRDEPIVLISVSYILLAKKLETSVEIEVARCQLLCIRSDIRTRFLDNRSEAWYRLL